MHTSHDVKTTVSIRLDADIVEFFNERAPAPNAAPYQTQTNTALREYVDGRQPGDLDINKLGRNEKRIAAIVLRVRELASPSAGDATCGCFSRLASALETVLEFSNAGGPDCITITRHMNPRIIAITRGSWGTVFPVTASDLNIGRDEANHVCIDDNSASRRHCRIRLENGQALLVDTESRNGTYVNGFCFPTKILVHGDRIAAGSERFVYADREEVDDKLLEMTPAERIRGTLPTEQAEAFQAAQSVVLNAFLRINASINTVRSPE